MTFENSIELGIILKNIRREKNFTLSHVANKLDITPSLLSQIENDKITPSLQTRTVY